tara:strand:- start:184 stop:408 length:225 start_codon:yes stop_codon:yes gene_type:complete
MRRGDGGGWEEIKKSVVFALALVEWRLEKSPAGHAGLSQSSGALAVSERPATLKSAKDRTAKGSGYSLDQARFV